MPTLFKKAPFTFDPTYVINSAETSEDYHTLSRAEEAKMRTQDLLEKPKKLAILRPLSEDVSILADINRDMKSNLHINGQSVFELRKKERLSSKQCEIADFNETAVSQMTLEQIKKHFESLLTVRRPDKGSEIVRSILECKDSTQAQNLVKQYQKLLVSKDTLGFETILEAKEFLKKHLLFSIKDPKEQDFLAEQAIRGLHQSGFTHVAEGYYTAKCQIATGGLVERPKTIGGVEIMMINPAEREGANLTCKQGRVFFQSAVRYDSMTGSDGVKYDPDVKVSSTFSIKASKSFFSKQFKVDFRVDKLSIKMRKDKTLASIFGESYPKTSILQFIKQKIMGKKADRVTPPPSTLTK